MKTKNLNYKIMALIFSLLLLVFANFSSQFLANNLIGLITLSLIYSIAAMSLNLINGFTGLFSLGHAGFMAVGAYVTAILTLSPEQKTIIYTIKPIAKPLLNLNIPFPLAIVLGGLLAALFGYLIGLPVLRLKGDYLAVASLGFGEIIVIIFTNLNSITNGSLGLSGLPSMRNWAMKGRVTNFWPMLFTIITFFLLKKFIDSSYGKALKAIREDEIAAEAMGIGLAKHKILAFSIGALFAGIAGGLLALNVGSIVPTQFNFISTYYILLMVVIGGMGSLTGSILSAFIVTFGMEFMRPLDNQIMGLRMVVFSILLILCVLFFRKGIMGTNEITFEGILNRLRGKKSKEVN